MLNHYDNQPDLPELELPNLQNFSPDLLATGLIAVMAVLYFLFLVVNAVL